MTDLDSMFDDLLGDLDDIDSEPETYTSNSPSIQKQSTLDDLLMNLDPTLVKKDDPLEALLKEAEGKQEPAQNGNSLDDLLNEFNSADNTEPVSNTTKADSLDSLLNQLDLNEKPASTPAPVNTTPAKSDNLDDLLSQLGGADTPVSQPQVQNTPPQQQYTPPQQQYTPPQQQYTPPQQQYTPPQQQYTPPQQPQTGGDSLESLLGNLGGPNTSISTGNLGGVGTLASDILLSQGYRRSGPRPTVSVIDVDNNTATNFQFKGTPTAQIGKTHVIKVCPMNDYNQPTPLINYPKYLIGFLTSITTGKEEQVYTKDNGDATYDIAFIPSDISQYYLEVLLCGNPLFELTIEVQNISGSSWRAVPGQAKVNETLQISILPMNGFDPTVLPGPLAFSVDGAGNMKDLNIQVNPDQTYTVTAVPLSAGKIQFSISLHGEPVLGSPLNIFVINPQQQARPNVNMNVNHNNRLIGTPSVNMSPGIATPKNHTPMNHTPMNHGMGGMSMNSPGVTSLQPNNAQSRVGNRRSLTGITGLQPNNMGMGSPQSHGGLQPNNMGGLNMYGGMGGSPMGGSPGGMGRYSDPRNSVSFGGLAPNPNLFPGRTSMGNDNLESMLSSLTGNAPPQTTSNDDELEAMMKELENYQ